MKMEEDNYSLKTKRKKTDNGVNLEENQHGTSGAIEESVIPKSEDENDDKINADLNVIIANNDDYNNSVNSNITNNKLNNDKTTENISSNNSNDDQEASTSRCSLSETIKMRRLNRSVRNYRKKIPKDLVDEDDDDSDDSNNVVAGNDTDNKNINKSDENDSDEGQIEMSDQDEIKYDDDRIIRSDSECSDVSLEMDPEDVEANEKIFRKEKSKYKWNVTHEVSYRQYGLSSKGYHSRKMDMPRLFQDRVYGSLHYVERLELMYKLKKHIACVNCLNFNKSGELLVSGSDDRKIVIWKWASNTVLTSMCTQHSSNIYQTKFVDLDEDCLSVLTTSRDGYVGLNIVPSSGGMPYSEFIYRHGGAVHKIATTSLFPYDVLTAGDDGLVVQIDLREKKPNRLVRVKCEGRKIPLYSIASHPIDNEFCVSGRDRYVRVYDRRNCKMSVRMCCPDNLLNKESFSTHITCAVYDTTGNEILASYNDDDIYLFSNKPHKLGTYLHSYSGHGNSSTIKGVSFYGPNSEFILSGSDCGNLFFWDKNTEALVQWMAGDESGIINCLEPHPAFPILATSGLDADVKIWVPSSDKLPAFTGLHECVRKNYMLRLSGNSDMYDDHMFRLFVDQCFRQRSRRASHRNHRLSDSDSTLSFDDNNNFHYTQSDYEDNSSHFSDITFEDDGDTEFDAESVNMPCNPS